MTIQDIDCSEDDTPVSFEGIPPEWEIKTNMLKLRCVDGKPIELGRGGYGVVLYGEIEHLLPVCPLKGQLKSCCGYVYAHMAQAKIIVFK